MFQAVASAPIWCKCSTAKCNLFKTVTTCKIVIFLWIRIFFLNRKFYVQFKFDSLLKIN